MATLNGPTAYFLRMATAYSVSAQDAWNDKASATEVLRFVRTAQAFLKDAENNLLTHGAQSNAPPAETIEETEARLDAEMANVPGPGIDPL